MLVFDNPSDREVEVVAKIMTINRFVDSSSSIVVTDNGRNAFGPHTEGAERWNRKIAIKGRGRHELLIVCQNVNSEPVYCALDAQDAQVTVER